MRHLYYLSRFGVLNVLTFVFLVFAFRMTLPFGDEPDFTIRSVELMSEKFSAWTPYFWISEILGQLDINSDCIMDVSPTSVGAFIDHASCTESFSQQWNRSLLTLFVCSPLLILLMWRGMGVTILNLMVSEPRNELNMRYDAVGLSLLIPGVIYYLGLLSHEQWMLLMSFFIFLFWGNWLLVTGLLMPMMALDFGNSMIVVFFILMYFFVGWIAAKIGLKKAIAVLGFMFGLIYIFRIDFLSYLRYMELIGFKVDAIYEKMMMSDFSEKYPVFLRPVITYMTTIFMTPAGVKLIPLYLFFAFLLIALVNRLSKKTPFVIVSGFKNGLRSSRWLPHFPDERIWMIAVTSSVFTIIVIVSIFPDYANAKYYIFMIPFFVRIALMVFSSRIMYFYFTMVSVSVPVSLLVYRMQY